MKSARFDLTKAEQAAEDAARRRMIAQLTDEEVSRLLRAIHAIIQSAEEDGEDEESTGPINRPELHATFA